jgi:hypothetical protein
MRDMAAIAAAAIDARLAFEFNILRFSGLANFVDCVASKG